MTEQYFKATDGKVTLFRASRNYVYVTATWASYKSGAPYGIGFSRQAEPYATSFNRQAGTFPVIEIDKGEYDRLAEACAARLEPEGYQFPVIAPEESWVYNR